MFKICSLALSLICFSLHSQDQDFKIKRLNAKTGLPSIIEFPGSSLNFPNPENAGLWMRNNLKANSAFSLNYHKSFTGKDGQSHLRYQQFFGRFQVEFAEVILHQKDNRTLLLTGMYFPDMDVDTNVALTQHEALQTALALFPGSKFQWEIPAEEQQLKLITGNKNSTYRPKGSLVVFSANMADLKSFRLAYKFDIFAYEPHSRKHVYIDAITGEILDQTEQICSIDRVGVGHTKYSGSHEIMCDSVAPGYFRLAESGRGGGIVTLNARVIGTGDTLRDFTNPDNNWDLKNEFQDEVAIDVHWASEKTYDYYMSKFGHNSYDNMGSPILSKMHVLQDNKPMNNAFWNGVYANYGDGDGSTFRPLTSIDICAHELSHGFTQFSAGLVYKDESGALNESFSDIFGKAVEFYATPSTFTWKVGDSIKISGKPYLRNIPNPNDVDMPRYYLGKRYKTGSFDNGGVHYNSGVQNYWFYLLSEGISETNEVGNFYKIDSLGIDKAALIAYHTLHSYLNPQSEYLDACYLSIEAATALYGEFSTEVLAVKNAWYAVGLYDIYASVDDHNIVNNWKILPNPAGGQIMLSNPDVHNTSLVRLTDITGKSLMETSLEPMQSLDISSYDKGIYFITINNQFTLKLVKE
jgi:bacillolysin